VIFCLNIIIHCVLCCLCSFVCCVLSECGVLFCVMCVICVLCLIVVPLPPGKNPFAVKINKKKKKNYDEKYVNLITYTLNL
jgi:hypothetical protein